MAKARLPIPLSKIAGFCRRWKVIEFALFGSVVREDLRPESDVDVLVSFAPDARWGLSDLARMTEELEALFGRRVHLVEKEALRNPFRRHAILTTRQVIYAACPSRLGALGGEALCALRQSSANTCPPAAGPRPWPA